MLRMELLSIGQSSSWKRGSYLPRNTTLRATLRLQRLRRPRAIIYAETCPQYLFLTRKDLDKLGFEGAKCVCSPPPREGKQDHEGIWQGIENGTFTILSSDHCPFIYNNNETGKESVISAEYPIGHFKYIPNGCPGVETRLS
jgi:dihydropyrimidinase